MLKRREAELIFRRIGITFAVYTEGGDPERLIPFDIIPRVLDAGEWALLARGLEQRVRALNAFLRDVYGPREIVRAGQHPGGAGGLQSRLRRRDAGARRRRPASTPISPASTWCAPGPTSSTCSRTIAARRRASPTCWRTARSMMRLFPELFGRHRVRPVSHYPEELLETLRSVAPRNCPGEPTVALLTPGAYNSAYYEHSFLADEMGIELVEGVDLVVDNLVVYMRTTRGLQRVDVIYRRIDDDFLDPIAFRPDSSAGRAGADGGLPRRQRHRRQRGRRRRRRRQGDLLLRARDDPLLPRRGAAAPERADLAMRAAARAARTSSPTCTSWWSRTSRGPAATACWSGRTRRRPSATTFAAKIKATPDALHRAADPGAVHLPDLRRERRRAAPCRPPAVRADGPRDPHRARRADARGAARRLAGRQFEPGRRHQGHLGRRHGGRMLSRTADSLYWLARYMERVENTARLLDVGMRMASLSMQDGADAGEWHSTLVALGCDKSFYAKHDAADRRGGDRPPGVRSRQPVLDPVLHRDRAAQLARDPHGAHGRHVGRGQLDLARCAPAQGGRFRAREHPQAARLGEGALAAFRRRRREHHAAQRRLLVRAPRHLPRARRQHRAHPRREVPCAAAGVRDRRRRRRLLPLDGDPALGLGAARLPLGLPRAAEAVARRRAADPAAGDAALAVDVLRRDHRAISTCWPGPMARAANATGWRGRCTRI